MANHFYSVTQSMDNGEVSLAEWDVIKETPKTVSYGVPGEDKVYATKNKSSFLQVHLDSKSDYTGRFQSAYVFAGVCSSKQEALEKVLPVIKEWHESLSKGLDEKLASFSNEQDFEEDEDYEMDV